jgi:hypothetical protein
MVSLEPPCKDASIDRHHTHPKQRPLRLPIVNTILGMLGVFGVFGELGGLCIFNGFSSVSPRADKMIVSTLSYSTFKISTSPPPRNEPGY